MQRLREVEQVSGGRTERAADSFAEAVEMPLLPLIRVQVMKQIITNVSGMEFRRIQVPEQISRTIGDGADHYIGFGSKQLATNRWFGQFEAEHLGEHSGVCGGFALVMVVKEQIEGFRLFGKRLHLRNPFREFFLGV